MDRSDEARCYKAWIALSEKHPQDQQTVHDWSDAYSAEDVVPHILKTGSNSLISPAFERNFSQPRRVRKEFERCQRIMKQVSWQFQPVPITSKHPGLGRIDVRHQDIENASGLQ